MKEQEAAPERELIVKIGGEGGSVKLFRVRRRNGAWGFAVVTDESTLASLLDEDDLEGLELVRESPLVPTLDAGIALLDRYPWAHLYPLFVHPEFCERIRAEVAARLPESEDRYNRRHTWESVLQGG